MKQRKGIPEPAAWALHTRAYVLLLSGWQLAIIGSFNMWPFGLRVSRVAVALGYLLAGAFMILSYKLVAIADSSKQEGGSGPISYFGRPRPRRFFFAGFVYTPIGFLILMSVEWSDAPWCPTILRLPQFFLLLVALLSAVSAGLIFHRYRGIERNRSRAERVLATSTLLVLGLAAAVQIFLGKRRTDVLAFLRHGSLYSRFSILVVAGSRRDITVTLRGPALRLNAFGSRGGQVAWRCHRTRPGIPPTAS
jgi:hypothetical protein